MTIAKREFIERVRTGWFIAVTVLGPLGMVGLLVIPAWLGMRSGKEVVTVQVVDRTARNMFPLLARGAAKNVDLQSVPADVDEALLLGRIRDEKINGYLILPEDLLTGGEAVYRGDNATNVQFNMALIAWINAAAFERRANDAGISMETFARLGTPPIKVVARHDTGRGETKSPQASLVAGIAAMFLLYFSIIFYAVNVMRSVVQEKASRVVEIIVSAVKPSALMLGKVIGVGAVGLVQLVIWCCVALALIHFRVQLLGLFGIAGSGVDMPPLDAIDVLVILVGFLLGYFFYAALYAAVGAMVNSDQEAQQLQTPIMILLIVPVLCFQLIANDPRSGAAQLLTLVPFSSPILMPMRYLLGGVGPAELSLSLAILLASTAATVKLGGRIYRVGILMYGQRPSFRELARWIRYS
jgi:ABC-2 type transport system permease protein